MATCFTVQSLADMCKVNSSLYSQNLPEPRRESGGQTHWIPNADVYTSEEGLVVKAELAGMRREDLEISLEGNPRDRSHAAPRRRARRSARGRRGWRGATARVDAYVMDAGPTRLIPCGAAPLLDHGPPTGARRLRRPRERSDTCDRVAVAPGDFVARYRARLSSPRDEARSRAWARPGCAGWRGPRPRRRRR